MTMFSSMGVSGSALTLQRLRMDVAASNIANAETTRAELVEGQWQPYQRKMVVQEAMPFSTYLNKAETQLNQGVMLKELLMMRHRLHLCMTRCILTQMKMVM